MSWAEGENDSAEMEENPYPEEDSDLPHWQHHDGGELGFRGEEDGPEEDLAMAHGAIDINDAQNRPTGEADLHLFENVDRTVNSAACGCDESRDSTSSALPTTQFAGQGEISAVQYSNGVADIILDGDSFEQDEETAAPECENGVRHEACSESDMQLFQFEETIPKQSGQDSVHFEHDIHNLQPSGHPESEHMSQIQAATSELTEVVFSGDINSQQNSETTCTFSGDVETANTLDDAPEAEVCELKPEGETYLYEEEDNLSLLVGHENSQNTMSPPDVGEQSEDTEIDVRNVASIPINENRELAMHESVDHHLQTPECDREAVSYLQTSIGSHHGRQLAHATEAANLTQEQCDNSSDVQLSTEHDASEDQGLISNSPIHPASELLSRDSEENMSPVNPYNADANNLLTSCVSEDMPRTSEVAQTDQDKTTSLQDGENDSSIFPSDDFSAQSTDNGPVHHSSVPSSVDYQSHVQLPQANSHHDQLNSALHANHSAYSSSSISTQESDTAIVVEDTKKLDSNLDLNSAPLSLHVDIQSIRSPCSSNTTLNSQLQLSDSSSHDSTPKTSQCSSPAKLHSQNVITKTNHLERELDLALQSDDEDQLLHELDAELLAHTSITKSPQRAYRNHLLGLPDRGNHEQTVNGIQSMLDFRLIQEHNRQLLEQLKIRDEEIEKLTHERDSVKEALAQGHSQVKEQQRLQNADGHQIKTLENTVIQYQNEIKALKERLVSHDSAAKRAVTTLQNELKSRVDQITKMYEECLKEKDMIVIKFAESESKNMEAKCTIEKIEAKFKEAIKEKDSMINALKTAKSDKLKAVSNFEMKCAETSNLLKELEKLKEAVNSSDYRIKWFQNKLKDELESHKETKSNLEKTTIKLKEAREETEVIRKECHAIVKRYQESEEIKSNSLDKELKLKETELRAQLQERNDTQEVHQMTKRELESLKTQHKDIVEEVKTYKDKVHCLEEERKQNHQMIENHQEIMHRQKTDNTDLKTRIASLSNLEEDYKRAQEMIQTLDKDIAELKVINHDLQKDMESCRERESKMLTLQSELSRTNAFLRSENTNLSNKSSLLTGEAEKLKMEVQELETTVKDLSDKYEEEKTKRKDEVEKIGVNLAEKIKECNELKQKWEDEIDSNKTLKRRHANNVKDLTRQLQQVRKRLDTMEGKGDAGSMGSRTNSNGSLNSIENSSQQLAAVHQPPIQEFPVITEQVEIDKQVLIERIVRLQKAHARKNEKLEFLGEHIQQLLDEIRKKNKIIQCYAVREESGTLSSEDMDANKERVVQLYKFEVQREIQTLLARKGGIMASVYTVHQQDGSMTLELSLQINQKLQAVLEDTLLKNITLKESLDTLGAEIARLSQENRRLQLNLQEIEGRLT